MRAISEIHESFGVRLSTKTFLVSSLAQVAAEIDRLSTGRQTCDDDGARPNARAAKTGRFLGWLRNRMNGETANLAKNRE